MRLTQRQQRLLKVIGYPLLALVVFIMAVHWTFPYERVKDKFIDVVGDKYDVSVGSVERTTLPGGVIFKNIWLTTRPEELGQESAKMAVQKLRVDVGLGNMFAMMSGDYRLRTSMEISGGTIDGTVRLRGKDLAIDQVARAVPLAQILWLRGYFNNLPMVGGLSLDVDLELPGGQLHRANGTIRLSCAGCVVGDGKTKVKVQTTQEKNKILQGDGIAIPIIHLGTTSGQLVFKEGVLTTNDFHGESESGEFQLDMTLKLHKNSKNNEFPRSTPGCLRVKAKTQELDELLAVMGMIKHDDGFRYLRMLGKLSGRRKPWKVARSVCGPWNAKDKPESRKRPTVSSKPPKPSTRPAAKAVPDPPTEPAPPQPPELEAPGRSGPDLGKTLRPRDRLTADPTRNPGGAKANEKGAGKTGGKAEEDDDDVEVEGDEDGEEEGDEDGEEADGDEDSDEEDADEEDEDGAKEGDNEEDDEPAGRRRVR